jgi:hypothetical protein
MILSQLHSRYEVSSENKLNLLFQDLLAVMEAIIRHRALVFLAVILVQANMEV